MPEKMWQYKPGPAEWSIHEVLVHLADSEANLYVRARRFIAEPGSKVLSFDNDLWAKALDYHKQDATGANTEEKPGAQIMITIKNDHYRITISIIPSGQTLNNTVRTGIISLNSNIEVIFIKENLECCSLGRRSAIIRLELQKIVNPFA